jgi:hypothetical protein
MDSNEPQSAEEMALLRDGDELLGQSKAKTA